MLYNSFVQQGTEPAVENCQQAIIVADVIRAVGTEAVRIFEVSARLGIERKRTGRTPKELTAEDATRVLPE